MSHTLDMKTTMNDPEALTRALVAMGISRSAIELHKQGVPIETYDNKKVNAHVVVRKDWFNKNKDKITIGHNYAYSDLGFVQGADGSYVAKVDESNFDQTWVNKLGTHYNIEKAKIVLDEKKIKYTESVESGLPVIRATIPLKKQNRIVNRNIISFKS